VLNTLDSNQSVRHLLHQASLPLDQNYFETVVVIQMYMQRRKHSGVIMMLQLGELFRKKARVVVINQGHETVR